MNTAEELKKKKRQTFFLQSDMSCTTDPKRLQVPRVIYTYVFLALAYLKGSVDSASCIIAYITAKMLKVFDSHCL